jgi:hypothetical protein
MSSVTTVCIQRWQFTLPQYFPLLVFTQCNEGGIQHDEDCSNAVVLKATTLPTWVCSGSSHGALRRTCCCLVGLIEVIRTKVTCRLVSWPSIHPVLCMALRVVVGHSLHHLTAVPQQDYLPLYNALVTKKYIRLQTSLPKRQVPYTYIHTYIYMYRYRCHCCCLPDRPQRKGEMSCG